MPMRVTFPKNDDRHRVAVLEWGDGLIATTPVGGRATALPHDLSHYTIEAQFRPPYGFWTMAGRQAPFDSLTLIRGRWPRGRREWLERAHRKHRGEMLKAEATGVGVLADPSVDLDAAWPAIARSFRQAYAYGPENAFSGVTKGDLAALRARHFALVEAWESVPMGGALTVHWPPEVAPVVRTSYAPADVANR